MDQQVIWSPKAEANLQKLLDYLLDNFGKKYVQKYLDELEETTRKLALHPSKGVLTFKKSNIRRLVLDKHNYLLYSTYEDGIVIKNILPYKRNKKGF